MTTSSTTGSQAGERLLADVPIKAPDVAKVQEQNEAHAAAGQLYIDASDTKGGIKPESNAKTSSSAESILPALTIHHPGWLEGTENVAKELGKGAWTELTEHPGRVATSAAIGFGVGLGMTLLAPEIAAVAGVAAAGLAVYEVGSHAKQWYHDAKVVAQPEKYNANELYDADQGVESFGGGAVDVAAGILGGMAGARVGQSAAFNDLKETITNDIAKQFHPSYFDSDGHPIKLPRPDGNGSAYIDYDAKGQVTALTERPAKGWTSFFNRQTDPDGTSSWTIYSENKASGVNMATSPWKGDITLDPDSQGVTIIDKAATTNLRAGGTSTFAQTAEQVKGAAEWKALLNAQLAKLTAQAAASGDGPAVGAGIGTAAMGLGMMMR